MEENKMPEGVQMNVKYSRVLLEFLVSGTPEQAKRIKKMTTKMQEQMDKFRGGKKSRILYNTDGTKTEQERREWLIENSNSKYYVFTPENFSISNTYVRDSLRAIRNFESQFELLKQKGIRMGRKPIIEQAIPKNESVLNVVKNETEVENSEKNS